MDSNNLNLIKQEKWDIQPKLIGVGIVTIKKQISNEAHVKVFKMQPENIDYLYFNNFSCFMSYLKHLKFKRKG